MTYDGGVKNTFVDYIKVDRGYERRMEYEFASSFKLQAMLGCPAEIRYEHLTQTQYKMKTYRYFNCCFRKFHVDGVQSAEIIDPEHRKSMDWEEPPTHEEDENGVVKKVAGPPMASYVARRQDSFRANVQEMRERNSVAVTGNSCAGESTQTGAIIP